MTEREVSSERVSEERLREMISLCADRRGKFWTIEEADKGGMIGGYPRWLDKEGSYSATQAREMRKFASLSDVEASPEWAKVATNREYTVVQLDDYIPRKYDDCIKDVLYELLALRSSLKTVGVKKLEWEPEKYRGRVFGYRAKTDLTRYFVEDMGEGCGQFRFWLQGSDYVIGKFATDDAAKAAAQADYERRILSAIKAPSEGEAFATAWQLSYKGDDWYFARKASFASIDIERGIIRNITPLYTRPSSAAPSEVTDAALFLIERLDDFERGSLCDTIEDACRDFDGHVSPAIERLRILTAALKGIDHDRA